MYSFKTLCNGFKMRVIFPVWLTTCPVFAFQQNISKNDKRLFEERIWQKTNCKAIIETRILQKI